MRIAILGGLIIVMSAPAVSLAQPAPSAQGQKALPPIAAACRQKGLDRGLRGPPELPAFVRTCAQEAREACMKRVQDMNLRGADMKEFMRDCRPS